MLMGLQQMWLYFDLVFVYAACAAAKPGYTLKAHSTWVEGFKSITHFNSPAEAERACNSTSDCVAWSSKGDLVSGSAQNVTYTPEADQCIYVKNTPGE
jgi:hypothetical protein